jgi:alpha-amylase/alpha-mannosidase (GH57 family)
VILLNKKNFLISIFLIASFILSACTAASQTPLPTEPAIEATETPEPTEVPPTPTSTPTQEPAVENPLYLAIIWHQHQPVYFKDPQTGLYQKPWVRLHATKDYVDMAAILEQYPDIHATFNLTPSLIRQLDDLQAGAKDLYWVVAEVPAEQLSVEQQQFIRDRFFDTNSKIIARFPRYDELRMKRDAGEAFTTQDYVDLQVLFNLAWVDPDWLAQEPLASLVAKGRDYAEADKEVLFQEHQRLIAEVVPLHKKLQDAGQIEVTMTPYTHPILPLITDTDLAKLAISDIDLPEGRFMQPEDAVEQVKLGVELYEDHFGQAPRGMWPAEGSVAEAIIPIVAANGIQWMASDEGVLAASLGLQGFKRDENDLVLFADRLYRPYDVQGDEGNPVAMVFRDVVISDKVGFAYSGMEGQAAAEDFIGRLHAIRDALAAGGTQQPRLVSVILDGENAWEHYENDGKDFLHALYGMLSSDPTIKTVTPSEFLSLPPDQSSINQLWAGSWINHDFATWIGESEENQAWDLLKETRDFLAEFEDGTQIPPDPQSLEKARDQMFIAEGSDWFWWYGADQNSGNDDAFDQQFRDTLKQVYLLLGQEPPLSLDAPIIPLQAVDASQAPTSLISPTIDGIEQDGEWDGSGVYQSTGGAMAEASRFFDSLAYGFDPENLYLKVTSPNDFGAASQAVEIYLALPGDDPVSNFSRNGSILGFSANRMIEVLFKGAILEGAAIHEVETSGTWSGEVVPLEQAALGSKVIELAVRLSTLGELEIGDPILLRALHTQSSHDNAYLPEAGPAQITVPDLSQTTMLLQVSDPENDDYGPGTYTYPTDGVFESGNYDLVKFEVGEDEANVVFKFTLRGSIENPWGSASGLSLQTFDVYIDQDGDGQGGSQFLPGRNLALQDGFAWDLAVTVEGWESAIFKPGANGNEQVAGPDQLTILADPGLKQVTVRIPKAVLGDAPSGWRYAAVVLGQDGYASSGARRVRDVLEENAQWKFGGAPAGATQHTRVIDLVWPEPGQQEAWLSDFTSEENGFARIPMLEIP